MKFLLRKTGEESVRDRQGRGGRESHRERGGVLAPFNLEVWRHSSGNYSVCSWKSLISPGVPGDEMEIKFGI